jgi:hypothetical protein
MATKMSNLVFWVVIPCSLYTVINVPEEHVAFICGVNHNPEYIASIFRVGFVPEERGVTFLSNVGNRPKDSGR